MTSYKQECNLAGCIYYCECTLMLPGPSSTSKKATTKAAAKPAAKQGLSKHLNTLLNILKSSDKNEEQILKSVKKWFSQRENLSPTTIKLANISLDFSSKTLIACAQNGHFTILRYLIEEQGLDPNQVLDGKQSPLCSAIKKGHVNIACYLAQKAYSAKPLNPRGYLALHYAAEKPGMIEVTRILLNRYPKHIDTQSREGHTALLIAAKNNNTKLVELLIEKGANPNTADYCGQSPLIWTLINNNAEALSCLLKDPRTNPLPFENIDEHTQILKDLATKEKVVSCYNLWFEAGAGLDINVIPDSVLSLFKLQRETLKEFIIVGKYLDNGTPKRKIFTSIEQLMPALAEPKWEFNKIHLARACQNASFKHLPHVKQLQKLLLAQNIKVTKEIPVCHHDNDLVMGDVESVLIKNEKQILNIYEAELVLLNHFLEGFSDRFHLVSARDPLLRTADSRLLGLLYRFFECLNNMYLLTHHPITKELKREGTSVPLVSHEAECKSLIRPFLKVFMDEQATETSLEYFLFLEQKIKQLIKYHGNTLKATNQFLYDDLIDALAITSAKMARAYLERGNKDLALSITLEAMRYNDKIDDNNSANFSYFNRAMCYTTMAEVFLAHGWVTRAGRLASIALDQYKKTSVNLAKISHKKNQMTTLFDERICKLIPELADIYIKNKRIGKAISLLNSCIQYVDNVYAVDILELLHIKDASMVLKNKLALLTKKHFDESIAYLQLQLKQFAIISGDEKTLTISICFLENSIASHHHELLKDFTAKNKNVIAINNNQLQFNRDAIFAKNFYALIAEINGILSSLPPKLTAGSIGTHEPTKPVEPTEPVEPIESAKKAELDLELCEKFATLGFSLDKPQKSGMKPATKDTLDETYGFEPLPGFTRIVPIASSSLPNNTLFVTMPEDNAAFVPFYKLIRDPSKKTYFPVTSIAEKGKNKHGIKLGTTFITNEKQKEKISYGRLKIGGTDRAHGYIEQTVTDEKGKLRKLYVFRHVVSKKEEQRNRYSM